MTYTAEQLKNDKMKVGRVLEISKDFIRFEVSADSMTMNTKGNGVSILGCELRVKDNIEINNHLFKVVEKDSTTNPFTYKAMSAIKYIDEGDVIIIKQ